MAERTTRGLFDDRIPSGPDFRPFPDDFPQERPPTIASADPSRIIIPRKNRCRCSSPSIERQSDRQHGVRRPVAGADASRLDILADSLLAVVAAAGIAVLFALVTSDATRDLIATAKASIIGGPSDPTAPPQASGTQLTARDMQLDEPTRSPPEPPAAAAPVQMAAVAPTRDDIANAYQTALQNRVVSQPAPVAAPPASPWPQAHQAHRPPSIRREPDRRSSRRGWAPSPRLRHLRRCAGSTRTNSPAS